MAQVRRGPLDAILARPHRQRNRAEAASAATNQPTLKGFMDPIIWIAAAVILFILVLRFIFRITGLIIKLLILAAIGVAVWWIFSGM